MFTPDTFGVALLMMIASTVCWGSWELIALFFTLTLGSRGGPDSFLANVKGADPSNILLALLGGGNVQRREPSAGRGRRHGRPGLSRAPSRQRSAR
jgi:hypothetical protein